MDPRLANLLHTILPAHRFYARKFAGLSLDDWQALPFTTKDELLANQAEHPPYGELLTYPLERYTRLHQTSGTRGVPLRWLDTAESWDRMLGSWRKMFDIVGVTPADRLLFAFSFGPFLGFWTAFESAARMGCLCLAAGGLSSGARVRMLLDNRATVVLCTPTYALHLAQFAKENGIQLDGVRALIVAGEPGGSIPGTRARIEEAWKARVFDHSGMTEVGPLAIECPENPGGLHILEDDFFAEVIDPATGRMLPIRVGQAFQPDRVGSQVRLESLTYETPGQGNTIGELVLTNLGRIGSPLIRYRTGDLVRVDPNPCPCGRTWMRLAGGILGRTDDMIAIRGNNFYPGALENVLRRFAEVVEYRASLDRSNALAEMRIEIETDQPDDRLPARIVEAIRDELMFRAEVVLVAKGTLPRFEMKAQRILIK
ncbi:MAG: phenylacetate--CoA ligase family protein [Planctomycetes bacterium]|nr:phenylacetate--CoA ligase family protein [Planctomycetota bacterium]